MSLDIVVRNAHSYMHTTVCIECDLSDFHHIVCFGTKQYASIRRKRTIAYRSNTKFNEVMFVEELGRAPYHASDIFEDVNDSYWFGESQLWMDTHQLRKWLLKTTK